MFFVVVLEPSIQIGLQLVKVIVDFSAKSHPVKSIQHRLVKSLADTVALGLLALVLLWSMFSIPRYN